MLPDTGERYLSTPLFADVEADMDEAEWAISRSTPKARFDAPAAPPAAPAEPAEPATPATPATAPAAPVVTLAGRDWLDQAVKDPARPVLMFALEWCEFCWTLRRLFQRIGVPLHSVDLDTPALADEAPAWRAALQARTGQATIPQVFVGGEWIGGCTDTLAAWQDGRLQARLQALALPFDAQAVADPMALLPAWLQPRRAA
jgi:cysteine synthase